MENDIGDMIPVPGQDRQIYANKKSIRQSEFYQAAANGMKPELMFEVRSIDYVDEKELYYNDKPYTIIRTYTKNGEITELVCAGLVNNAIT
ncbi:phage head closure protein [Paenibacillus sp. TRM 82003]|nr:phage head closure protein [Paenibacillus sp. TRM 82003]